MRTNNYKFWQIIGFLWGDGVLSDDSKTFKVTQKHREILDSIKDILQLDTDVEYKNNYYQLTINDTELIEELKKYGYTKEKYSGTGEALRDCSKIIDTCTEMQIANFIIGLFLADGSVKYDSKSYFLAYQITTTIKNINAIKKYLLEKYEIQTSVCRNSKNCESFQLHISQIKSVQIFEDMIVWNTDECYEHIDKNVKMRSKKVKEHKAEIDIKYRNKFLKLFV